MINEPNWADQLEHLYRAAITVSDTHDVETALQTIVDSARELGGAEMAALGVPGKPGEPMAHFVTSGLPVDAHLPLEHPPIGRGVLSLLLIGGQSLRVADVRQHPAFRGYPALHPSVRSFLGVPIQSRGMVIGDLYLANKRGASEFTQSDERLIEMLAAHAAVVVQGLRHHEQMHQIALLEEREDFARQLQDDVLQSLYGVGLLLSTLNLHDPDRAGRDIAEIRVTFDEAIERLRQHLLSLTNQ